MDKVFHELHFLPEYFIGSGALKSYNKRVVNSFRKTRDATKKGKKTCKSSKERIFRLEVQNEGEESYKSGVLWNISLNISKYL